MHSEHIWHTSYDPGVPHAVNFEDVNVIEALQRAVQRFPQAAALTFRNRTLSYAELWSDVEKLASVMAELGVGKGTRVAVQLPNIPQAVIAYFATLALGGQVVMTNPLYMPREIEHQWKDASVSVAITTDFIFEAKLRAMRDSLPVKHYVVASIPEYLNFPLSWLAPLKLRKAKPPLIARVTPGPGIHFFSRVMSRASGSYTPPRIDLDDVGVLQYTGGTTGISKGAMLTHRNLSFNVQQCRAWFNNLELGNEVFIAVAPFFHVFGMTTCINLPTYVGASIVVVPNPRDTKTLITSIAKFRATVMMGVPAMYNAINNFPGIEQYDLTSLKVCISGSAPMPQDVQTRFEQLTGAKICEGFGLTETSPVTHVNPLVGKRKIGSIGVPLPNTESKVVDMEEGKTEVPRNKEGELIIRGPQVMKGYWNRPDETAKMIKDGWLYTGDLATMDEDGFFRIVGRKKDMILAAGYNVYPDEIDSVLMMHDAVLEAATIGVPCPKRGETIKSFIVLKPGRVLTEEEITAHCKQNLAAYKVPKLIEFIPELPKSTVLKVLRRELREQEKAKLANQ